jgi:hypothetical protein
VNSNDGLAERDIAERILTGRDRRVAADHAAMKLDEFLLEALMIGCYLLDLPGATAAFFTALQ